MKKRILASFIGGSLGLIIGVMICLLLVPIISPKPLKDPSTLWNVYEDEDNGVTCYIYDEKSISCLPTKELVRTP